MDEINPHAAKMELVQFSDCCFDYGARYCENCRQIVNDCNLACPNPECNLPYSDLTPIWHLYLKIVDNQINKNEKLDVEVIGSILDPVMGYSIKDFLYVIDKIKDDNWFEWIKEFFLKFSFAIYRSYDRIHKINLPPGVEIDFRKWVTPKLSMIDVTPEYIESILIEKYLDADNVDFVNSF